MDAAAGRGAPADDGGHGAGGRARRRRADRARSLGHPAHPRRPPGRRLVRHGLLPGAGPLVPARGHAPRRPRRAGRADRPVGAAARSADAPPRAGALRGGAARARRRRGPPPLRGLHRRAQRRPRRRAPPHESRCSSRPTPWTAADPLAITKLAAFMLSINWTTKIARQLVLERDGAEALRALEPVYAAHHPAGPAQALRFGDTADRLAESLEAVEALLGPRAASNAWALGAERNDTGGPLLASDPHVNPALPCFVYAAHLRTDAWNLAGAAFLGGPAIAFGHNGQVAWGVTSGLTDTVELYLEDEDPAGEVREELIAVRGRRRPVVERIVETPRGPVIGPAVEGGMALSIRAPWLQARPIRGFLGAEGVESFAALRERFTDWPSAPLNVIGVDRDGAVGWQLVGAVPRRSGPSMLPLPASVPGWEEVIPLDEMPGVVLGPDGTVGSANNAPAPDGEGPWLGADWSLGNRVERIREALAGGGSRTVAAAQALQRDTRCTAWDDVREAVLAAEPLDDDGRLGLSLLEAWDGDAGVASAGAAVYELTIAGLTEVLVRRKAPNAFRTAMGGGVNPRLPFHGWAARMSGTTGRCLREQPAGWLDEPWPRAVGRAVGEAVRRLREARGDDPAAWGWGEVRPVTLKHLLGELPGLGRLLDLGPIPWGGDSGTLGMGTSHPLDPLDNPVLMPTLRLVVPLAAPDEARIGLAGGQSGNPCSVHYDDLLGPFVSADGVPLLYSDAAVDGAVTDWLTLSTAASSSAGLTS
ncbi:MAG: penicillin acylase family protein [Myxococcota bacterium]